ncbi:MAG: serine/threonine-protein kinase [Candidatus Obscuribacterales bacterium]|jgi:serine/threonine protein kinase
MNIETCATCGKELIGTRAGSVTSYFFQHKYCQCLGGQKNRIQNKFRSSASTGGSSGSKIICSNCGKSRASGNRAGSMTSYLFKELRCTCAGARDGLKDSGKHTQTALRRTQRKQFTDGLFSRQTGDSEDAFAAQRAAILAPGTIIGGVFEVASVVGSGGMGVVYEVEHKSLGKRFALKVLSPELVNEKNWQRFKAEAKILGSLNNATFVKVYDLGIHDGALPYYSMDYLKGRSIEEKLIDDGPLPLNLALDIFIHVLDGLAYAHRHGIVHRDLKPGNIMLCRENGQPVVKVLDFGISKLLDSIDTKAQNVTMVGDIFGSPYYMSPEQVSAGNVDSRSDIYMIGCTLFETLTSFVPFEGDSIFDTMLMHQETKPPLISDVAPELNFSHSIVLVVAKCLAKLPEERYQSAKELSLDLERIREGKDLLNYPHSFPVHSIDSQGLLVEDSEQQLLGGASIVGLQPLLLATLLVAVIAISGAVYWLSEGNKIDHAKAQILAKPLPQSELRMLYMAPNTATQSGVNTENNATSKSGIWPESNSVDPKFPATATPQVTAASQVPATSDETEFPDLSSKNFLRSTVLKEAKAELADREKRFGPNSDKICVQLITVGSIHRDIADYSGAEPYYLRALVILKKRAKPVDRHLSDCLGGLASICEHLNRPAEAATLYKSALELPGIAERDLKEIRENYAEFLKHTEPSQ